MNPAAQFYTDSQRCIDAIKAVVNEQLLIVVSSSFATEFLQSIHDLKVVLGIFIFDDQKQSTGLSEKYSKIIDIVSDKKTLLTYLHDQSRQLERITLDFSLFNQKQKSTRDLTKESASFLWHQMLIYVLKQMPHNDRTMHEMLDQCAEYYQNNQTELAKIEQFRTTYTRDQAISWYTDECFLYKLLNQALRTEDIQLLYAFRFFIIDLCAELERESDKIKNEGHLTVYRGQMMHKEEFHKLQHSIGGLISTNGFFSTSRDINISFGFLTKSNSTTERVLFEIQADPSIPGVICADISALGSMPWEREVLFSLNTVFQIVSVNADSTHNVWKVQLVASDQGAEKVNDYVKWLQVEIDYSSPLVYFGRLLWSELGQLTQAESYYKMLLDTLSPDHPDIALVNLEFSHVYDEKGDYDLALQYSERALHIRQQQKPIVPIRLASCLNSMGVIYKHKSDLDRAIDYYQQSLAIYENELSSGKHLHQTNTLLNLGAVHKDKGNFDTALDYFTRAYEMCRELLPTDHPHIADALSSIGSIYHHREIFDQALGFYQQALDIQETSCPDDHRRKANTIRNIALIYRDKQDWNNAMEYFDRALAMLRRLLSDIPHPNIAICYGDIGQVYEKMGNWDQALDNYQRQLKMEEQCLSVDHPHLALHFDWIVSTLKKKGNINEAKKLCEEKLAMLPYLLGNDYANHPRYAHTLVSLATVLEDCDIHKADEYYKQAFAVLERHSHLEANQVCLSAMVNFFWKKNMYDQALIYQLKLVDLQRDTLSSNNKELAVSLCGLARLYQAMMNDKEAIKYFNQSLEIFRAIYGPDHDRVKDVSNELSRLKDHVAVSDSVKKEGNNTKLHVDHYYSMQQPMPDRQFKSYPASRSAKSAACTLL
ncbi:unnamed protein product [Rotaria sp. Silwood2]|nr:unnamed protein product [Rotaria sp. Silwood2]CAF2892930.1 unnamed protein product [Rotaria sp. Silwood2]CAF3318525.1 unnamed protein product [Rotaria sp. Silwood2]CAF4128451.1 unnamed protein product [Rotaria sp. Silwood2]CAF4180258.1 unnamed protein product [Rotaria sp. Silwood2]